MASLDKSPTDVDLWFQKTKVDHQFSELEQQLSTMKDMCRDMATPRRPRLSGSETSLLRRVRELEDENIEFFQEMHAMMDEIKAQRWKNYELSQENGQLKFEVDMLKHKLSQCNCKSHSRPSSAQCQTTWVPNDKFPSSTGSSTWPSRVHSRSAREEKPPWIPPGVTIFSKR